MSSMVLVKPASIIEQITTILTRLVLETSPDVRSDEELMLHFQKGEEAAFRTLVERHKKRVFAFAWRFLNGSSDAEDIAQEVFVKIYLSRESYRSSARFTTWMYVITRNTCLQALRKTSDKTAELDAGGDGPVMQIADPRAGNPSQIAIDNERSKKIAEALSRLPETQKMVILLRRYDQLSYEEIAEVMNCSVQAVKSLLFRGRSALKELLKEYFGDIIA